MRFGISIKISPPLPVVKKVVSLSYNVHLLCIKRICSLTFFDYSSATIRKNKEERIFGSREESEVAGVFVFLNLRMMGYFGLVGLEPPQGLEIREIFTEKLL